MADWEEIKRLAADFQRAQLSDTVQRLAERNCIEIVQKLQELSLISVIYTTDGKEYLTSQELSKEIQEELLVQGGRINLVDLQQILKVDYKHIEARVHEIVGSDKELCLVLGQIIDRNYLDSIAEEINDKLQANGQTTIAELTKTYDLPGDFMLTVVQERLGSIIEGKLDEYDGNTIYTDDYMAQQRSKVCGAFSAVTRPTSMMKVMNQFNLQDRLFFSILEELVNINRLAGSISGGRHDTAQYVPDIYTKAQNNWVDSFYKQNGYLEYASLSRLGISDAMGYIKKRWKGESLVYLSTCTAGPPILDRVQAEVDEALSTNSWLDIMPSLPSMFSEKDANQLLTRALKTKNGACIFCETIVASQSFVSDLLKTFESQMKEKADKEAKANPVFTSPEGDKKLSSHVTGLDDGSSARDDKKDQRRKKATGGGRTSGGGAGSQGRETKTKSTKKKGGRNRGDDSEDHDGGTGQLRPSKLDVEFLSVDDIVEGLQKVADLSECPDEFIQEIACQLYRPLCRQYEEMVKSVFLQQTGAATSSARQKTHKDLTEKICGLWSNIKLFEKSLKFFTEETQGHLCRHLLRTLGADITNLIFNMVAADHMMSMDNENAITPEVRVNLLSKIPDEKIKNVLAKLHTSLGGKSLEDFFIHLDTACNSDLLGIMLKRPDKKKERQLIFNHRTSLIEQLHSVTEAALGLHLAASLLFTVHTQCVIHAPGRCVPQLLQFLKEYIPMEEYTTLINCQDLVIQHLKAETEASSTSDNASAEEQANQISELTQQLHNLLPRVKDIAISSRRSAVASSQGNNE